MNSIDSILGMIATEAAEDVLTPQERRREVKEMSVEKLVEAFGNASFDCGHWRDKEDIPSAGNPEWEPYEQPLERWRAAKAALLAHVERLREERDQANTIASDAKVQNERLVAEVHNLRAENERLKAEKEQDAALIADGFELVKHVQQLEQRNAELRALAADIVRAVEILEPIEIADSAALQRLKDFLNVQG